MARSLWTGSISFGLVNVPVALFSAVRDLDVHFRQLHEKDGAPIETRRFCSEEDKEVPFESVGHGYEEDGKEQVVLTDDELAAAAPRRTRTIDIDAFVDVEDVDPIYFDHPYFLAPVGEAEGNLRAYRLLVKVMSSTDRAALGRFVLRSKEYLVLVRVREDRLALTTMLFHDEMRPAKDVDTGGRKPPKTQVDTAVALVKALSVDWDPEQYRDCYRERLLGVIERKRKGGKIAAPEKPRGGADGPPKDIMAALKESLERARSGEGFEVSEGDGDGAGGDGSDGDGVGGDGSGLEGLSRDELYERAQKEKISGRSSMSREELIEALSG
jgi:DNA end-binding protein Ku